MAKTQEGLFCPSSAFEPTIFYLLAKRLEGKSVTSLCRRPGMHSEPVHFLLPGCVCMPLGSDGDRLFQMVISYVGIFFDEREFSILNPMRPFVWLIVLIIGPPILIHDLVFPRIRLGFSYIKKTAGRIPAAKDLKIPKMTQFKPSPEQFKIPDTKLIDILVIEHVMLNVVDYMHYEDVINLSLACKAARELVYPSRDLDHRIPKLKKRCCDTFFKSGCLYCNKRICLVCLLPSESRDH